VRYTAHTTSRADELATFTGNYLLDGLVFAGPFVDSLDDLEGARVAVQSFPPEFRNRETVIQALDSLGITAEVVTFEQDSEVLEAVASGVADALASLSLLFLVQDDPNLATIWSGQALEPIAAAVPLGQLGFAEEVDAAIASIVVDGTWLRLYRDAFGKDPPYTIDEMRNVPPVDR